MALLNTNYITKKLKIFSNDKQTSCTYGSLFLISCDIRLGGVQKNKILRLILSEQTDSI